MVLFIAFENKFNLKMKRKQMSCSVFEGKDVKNHGLAWSLENSSTFSEKMYWCIALRYQLELLPILEIVMYIYIYRHIYIYMIYECIYVHTHPLIHTLWDIPVKLSQSKLCFIVCVLHFFWNLQFSWKCIHFLRYICRGFQDSKFGRTFKEIKLV